MVSSKTYLPVGVPNGYVDGSVTQFLADFIIKSEQHVRVYSYLYDEVTYPLPT